MNQNEQQWPKLQHKKPQCAKASHNESQWIKMNQIKPLWVVMIHNESQWATVNHKNLRQRTINQMSYKDTKF